MIINNIKFQFFKDEVELFLTLPLSLIAHIRRYIECTPQRLSKKELFQLSHYVLDELVSTRYAIESLDTVQSFYIPSTESIENKPNNEIQVETETEIKEVFFPDNEKYINETMLDQHRMVLQDKDTFYNVLVLCEVESSTVYALQNVESLDITYTHTYPALDSFISSNRNKGYQLFLIDKYDTKTTTLSKVQALISQLRAKND